MIYPREYNAVEDFIDRQLSITYGKLQTNSFKVANLLHAHGLEQEDRIALLVHDTVCTGRPFFEELSIQSIKKTGSAYRFSSLPEKLKKYHGERTDSVFWGWNKIWLDHQFQQWNISHELKEIDSPVLIIQCEDDEYGSVKQVNMAQKQLPQLAELMIYKEGGHSPQHSNAVSVSQRINRFCCRC